MSDNLAHSYNQRQLVTINALPNEVLLAIFDFYVVRYQDLDPFEVVFRGPDTKRKIESWQSLVHVCRRWRGLVFQSPHRLNLQILCIPGTSARMSLDIWPAIPLLINEQVEETSVENVVTVLKHSDRICQISLHSFTSSLSEKLCTAMQVPFPELEFLYLSLSGGLSESYVLVFPDSFLGGSSPRLRCLYLRAVSFPGLPKLLLSVTDLVELSLVLIPHSGYISPETMATCLSVLTNLRSLYFQFKSPQSSPDQENRHPPSPTRFVLPALTFFGFKGANEYLEELVARIDTPRLEMFQAIFFNDIEFDTPETIRFVGRSLMSNPPYEAHIFFGSRIASVKLQSQGPEDKCFEVQISCREPIWQLSSLAQICTTCLPLQPTMEDLFIYEPLGSRLDWKDGIENIEWLDLLLPFTAVKNLYLSKQFAPRIAPALEEMTGGGTTGLLSTLQNLYLEGFAPSDSVEEGIERFISARLLANRPVAISVWDRDVERESREDKY